MSINAIAKLLSNCDQTWYFRNPLRCMTFHRMHERTLNILKNIHNSRFTSDAVCSIFTAHTHMCCELSNQFSCICFLIAILSNDKCVGEIFIHVKRIVYNICSQSNSEFGSSFTKCTKGESLASGERESNRRKNIVQIFRKKGKIIERKTWEKLRKETWLEHGILFGFMCLTLSRNHGSERLVGIISMRSMWFWQIIIAIIHTHTHGLAYMHTCTHWQLATSSAADEIFIIMSRFST